MGKIVFVSGPSGVGKGTLIQELKTKHSDWVFPPSYSTRPPREGESNGSPYYFISRKEFQEKIKKNDFLEYAFVHNRDYYGTDRDSIFVPAKQGKTVVKEFDVQGFEQIRKKLPQGSYLSLFLSLTGGKDELLRRIQHRGAMSKDELQQRIISMEHEFSLAPFYSHVVLNDTVEMMVEQVEELIFLAPSSYS